MSECNKAGIYDDGDYGVSKAIQLKSYTVSFPVRGITREELQKILGKI